MQYSGFKVIKEALTGHKGLEACVARPGASKQL